MTSPISYSSNTFPSIDQTSSNSVQIDSEQDLLNRCSSINKHILLGKTMTPQTRNFFIHNLCLYQNYSLPLSLFNKVFCNPLIAEKILDHVSKKTAIEPEQTSTLTELLASIEQNTNVSKEEALSQFTEAISQINPRNSLFSFLNNVPAMLTQAKAWGWNDRSYQLFQTEDILSQDEIQCMETSCFYYTQQFSIMTNKIVDEIKQRHLLLPHQSFMTPTSDYRTPLLSLPHLLNQFSQKNFLYILKQLLEIKEKIPTFPLFCAFIYNLLTSDVPSDSPYNHGACLKNKIIEDFKNYKTLIFLQENLWNSLDQYPSYSVLLLLLYINNNCKDFIVNKPGSNTYMHSYFIKQLLSRAKEKNCSEKMIALLERFV